MYRIFTTIANDETDLIIKYLERVQLGYSDLILLAMENGWSEEMILADIEALVKRCFDDENANMINQRHFQIHLKLKRTSGKYHTIFLYV